MVVAVTVTGGADLVTVAKVVGMAVGVVKAGASSAHGPVCCGIADGLVKAFGDPMAELAVGVPDALVLAVAMAARASEERTNWRIVNGW